MSLRQPRPTLGSILPGPEPRYSYAEAQAARILWPRQTAHDGRWDIVKGGFFADLGRAGLRYDDLAAWCEARWGRHPSEDPNLRNNISRNLSIVAREVRAWMGLPPNKEQ